MNREKISRAISGIRMDYIAESERYTPPKRKRSSDREETMGRFERKKSVSSRRVIGLILAACLILGLAVTAYATGFVQSLFFKRADSLPVIPNESRLQEDPGYAEWLDSQKETEQILQEIGANVQQVHEEVNLAELAGTSITMTESYYDGEKIGLVFRFKPAEIPVSFDFDTRNPEFSQLEEGHGWEDWREAVPSEEDRRTIERMLAENGQVGFTGYVLSPSDHVYVNGEDLYCVTALEDEGMYMVEPFSPIDADALLPESCRNQASVEVTLRLHCSQLHFWLEGNLVKWVWGDTETYPITFTLENSHQN